MSVDILYLSKHNTNTLNINNFIFHIVCLYFSVWYV